MDKAQIEQEVVLAEQRCRVLFDQLITGEEQVKNLKIELERARGDYRTLQRLVEQWGQLQPPQPNLPVQDFSPAPASSFPGGELPHPADTASESAAAEREMNAAEAEAPATNPLHSKPSNKAARESK